MVVYYIPLNLCNFLNFQLYVKFIHFYFKYYDQEYIITLLQQYINP